MESEYGHGNAKRGTGILNNELYIGRLVWNRLRYVKNPDTGKRVSRLNPSSEWLTKNVPELRIISDELWAAAKERQNATRRAVAEGGNTDERGARNTCSRASRSAACAVPVSSVENGSA